MTSQNRHKPSPASSSPASSSPASSSRSSRYSWRLLIPSHRYVFTVNDGSITEHNRSGEHSFHRFHRYQSSKADHDVYGMIAWPNTVLLQGSVTAVVDPGLRMQGPPLLLSLDEAGLSPADVGLVLNTHAHDDHTQGNDYFPSSTIVVHELEASAGRGDRQVLSGDEGEVAPGLRFVRTPGHTEGSVCFVVNTEEGRVILAGDTVGPLPRYFADMFLPDDFPQREKLLASWEHIRSLRPAVVIPGHNPPIRMDWHSNGESARN